MSRRFLLVSTAAVSLALGSAALTPPALGQEVPPEVQNSKNAAIGQISADAVYVRSGAGDNYYPTMKLDTGAKVTVVGERFDWLKVLPPEGSFCYIAKAFVDRNGETGTVNRQDVNVRAGSSLNAMKTTVQAKLEQGQQVTILGEQDEYYKIAPPPDAFVYVKKEFVKPVQALPQVALKTGQAAGAPQAPAKPISPTPEPTGPAVTETPTMPKATGDAIAGGATTQPAGGDAVAGASTTQPAGATASVEQRFDQLEADFKVADSQKIEEQPIDQMLQGYQKVIADARLPESMRRVADFRVQQLKARVEAREQLAAVMKQQDEARKRTQALKAEQEELAQQIKKNEVTLYAAVGELRTSSLQQGPQILYRLTDPANGRTVCYVRSDDQKVAGMIGQFVGIKGTVTTDPGLNLRTIEPSDVEPVAPDQVFRGVASEIVPPSLLPQGAQAASSAGQE